MTDEQKIEEYIKGTAKHGNKMLIGVVLASLVYLISMIAIIVNSWWQPFGGFDDGKRWLVTACIGLAVIYGTLVFDKLYRNY